MPLVEMPKSKFVKEVRERAQSTSFRSRKEKSFRGFLSDQAKKHDVSMIGSGAEHFVFAVPGDNEKIVTVNYGVRGSREAKLSYYLQRIYSTLWPNNFPHMFASYSSRDENAPAATVEKRIHKARGKIREPRNFAQIIELPTKDGPTKSFDYVVRDCLKYGIPFRIDTLPHNFILGKDGGEYYVDEIDYTNFLFNGIFPADGILRFMEDKKFSELKIKQVQTSIRRINHLLTPPTLNEEVI
jgi:hypothetical protein